jgi:hypothetical protein
MAPKTFCALAGPVAERTIEINSFGVCLEKILLGGLNASDGFEK